MQALPWQIFGLMLILSKSDFICSQLQLNSTTNLDRQQGTKQTGLAIYLQAPFDSLLYAQKSLNQSVPVKIEHDMKIKIMSRIIPQPQPEQLTPRPNPNLPSAHSNTLFNRNNSSSPCKQPWRSRMVFFFFLLDPQHRHRHSCKINERLRIQCKRKDQHAADCQRGAGHERC